MPDPATSFSFVHAADLHLDTPFSGVQAVAPGIARALRDASLAAFDAVVELALAREVAFVLIAGDVYDGAERGLRAQLHFRDGLARLSAAGISSFVVHGNHDPLESGWSALGNAWPEGVTVFGCESVDVVAVERDGVQLATVQGISYAQRDTTENLARRFSRPPGPGVHLGLLHCNVEGAPSGHANYAPCTLGDLRATRLDYLALGHVHERRVLAEGTGPGDPWVVYPGNTQARSPRHSETGAKGAYVVEVRDGRVLAPEFVACDRVRFAELACEISELSDLGELEAELRELAERAQRDAQSRSVIVRAAFTGRGGLHGDLSRPGVLDELLAHLRDRSPESEPFCWWDSIHDESIAPGEVEELLGRGDFAADLLEIVAAVEEEGADLEALIASIVGEAPRSLQLALDRLATEPQRRLALLGTARQLALDQLGEP